MDVPHINPRKDKEYYFKEIMKKYSISSKNFIVVGDNLLSEIIVAKKLGMTSVLFDSKQQFNNHEIRPDYVVNSLEKIPKI
ncbi:HAD hydrolase-like protein [Riemerella anatipestifer]|nr:HAD hydrolase-like protein [Riemerella anatipestifer]